MKHWIGYTLIAVASALLAVSAAQLWGQDERIVVRAHAFELVSPEGEVAGVLTTVEGTPLLALGFEEGPTVLLGASPGLDASLLLSAGDNVVVASATADQALVVVSNGDEHTYLPPDAPTATKPLSWGDLKDLAR